MRSSLVSALAVAVAATLACRPPQTAATPPADDHPLSGLTGQRVLVAPAYLLRAPAAEVPWTTRPGSAAAGLRSRDVLRALDSAIAGALAERGLARSWVLPEALVASHTRNPTYAPDPYGLAEEPLRSPSLEIGDRIPDPLASQLRTAIALNDARIVLAPVELRFEKAATRDGGAGGRAALRVVVVDARTTEVRWLSDARSDVAPDFGPAVLRSLAARVADLFAAP